MEMLENKTIIIEMKIVFHGLISRLNTDKEGISELEYRSIEIPQKKCKRKKNAWEGCGSEYSSQQFQLILNDLKYA